MITLIQTKSYQVISLANNGYTNLLTAQPMVNLRGLLGGEGGFWAEPAQNFWGLRPKLRVIDLAIIFIY